MEAESSVPHAAQQQLLYKQTPNVTVRRFNFSLESLRQVNYDDWMVLSNLVTYCSYELAAENTKRLQVAFDRREEGTKEMPLVFYDVDVRLPPETWIDSRHTARLHGISLSRLKRCAHHLSVTEQCAMLSLVLAGTVNPIDVQSYCCTQYEMVETAPVSRNEPGPLLQITRSGPGDNDDRGILKRQRTTAPAPK